MCLKCVQIANPIFDELRPNQLPVLMPLRPIRRENSIPEKVLPVIMERLALSVICELGRENRFGILGIDRK